ncbi:hypothetical protein [Cupriavidus gilardii]|uniref:Uncharacterized protein n=1 Tax=Cupriavidus gilardii TaxID=82541 RepID=A0ABY4VXH7_9BURK|nr:hypothetical protein [Cupriavidus gilardii]MCT9125408.1 hypothetical protein [Cupriavidus gilardii]USE79485.1 hypothetical protein NDR89_23120 [Cupriavidus gilardii]
MSKRLLTSGVSTTFFHEEQDGKVAIESVADVEPIIERAKALHNAGINRTGMGDRHVASIPIIVLDAWARKRGLTFQNVMQDQALMSQFLQDPDHSYFIIDKASVK